MDPAASNEKSFSGEPGLSKGCGQFLSRGLKKTFGCQAVLYTVYETDSFSLLFCLSLFYN